MSSFSCPHIDSIGTYCQRLKADCVPGRKGCVLDKKYVFAVPAEDRIKERENNVEKKKLSLKDDKKVLKNT